MARAKASAADPAIHTFTAVIEPDEDGGYVVTFPAIPDLATQGETLAEARLMAEECLRGYLEVLRETGRPMPAPGGKSMPSARHDRQAPDPDWMSRQLRRSSPGRSFGRWSGPASGCSAARPVTPISSTRTTLSFWSAFPSTG